MDAGGRATQEAKAEGWGEGEKRLIVPLYSNAVQLTLRLQGGLGFLDCVKDSKGFL